MKNLTILTRLFLLNLIVLAISCSSNQKIEDSDKKNRWSDFDVNSMTHVEAIDIIDSSSIKIVRLETNRESAFARIDKIIATDEFILVCDYDNTRAVLMFDREGNFIRRISRVGRGPGEFNWLTAVDVDQINKQIILYDLNNRKLIFYGYDGVLLKEIYLKNYYGMTFTYINDTLFAFYLHTTKLDWGDDCELIFANNDGEIVNTAFKLKFEHDYSVVQNLGYFTKSNSKTYFIPTYRGKIYQIIDDNNIVEEFDFQLDEFLFTSKEINNLNAFEDIDKYKKFTAFSEFIINSKGQFICKSKFNDTDVEFLGDTRTGNVVVYSSFFNFIEGINTTNDLRFKKIAGFTIATYDDYFISLGFAHNYFSDADRSENRCVIFYKMKDDLNLDEL